MEKPTKITIIKKLITRVENKIIRALIVDSFPRWEYRFLRNALNRDPGVDLSCILIPSGHEPFNRGKLHSGISQR